MEILALLIVTMEMLVSSSLFVTMETLVCRTQ